MNEQQKRFAEEYIIDLNATQAAIRAGYSEKTARSQGQRLLTNVDIQDEIQRLKNARSKRCEVSADKVLMEYAKIGFSNISDYLKVDTRERIVDYQEDEEGNKKPITEMIQSVELFDTDTIEREKMDAVAEIKQTRDGIALKLHDKKGALDSIARHLGMFNDNINIANKDGKPFEVSNTHDLSKLSVEELKQLESILSKTE